MAKKKTEEIEEMSAEPVEEPAVEEAAAEASADEITAEAARVEEAAPEKQASRTKKTADAASAGEAATSGDAAARPSKGKRAEKIGVVSSDKMTKTVVVRVDRLVKHPIYRKYVKKRKKFMAHDETGAKIGDKVRIVETRPLSARKRWRVVEIIQKAEM